MKKIVLFMVSSFTALAVMAQTSTVTITVKGNRSKEVLVDGNSYTVNTDISSPTAVNMPITVTGLASGQHTLEVKRSNQYNNTISSGKTTVFNLRSGYDMAITINSNGSIQQTETRIRRNSGNTYRTPMSAANFNVLLTNIQHLRSTNSKVVALNNAFNNTGNYFTVAQAVQLIGLVNSQSTRLSLAKTSYKTITNPANFTTQMNQLIVNQAGRNDLAAYVSNYNLTNTGNTGNIRTPMTDANFNALYLNAQGQWPASAKLTYLTTVFATASYYFTTAKAKQLIGVVYPENERLQLAKASYDNIVDPANFTQLYDLLSYQSSRNELAAYVSNNSYNNPRVPMTASNFNSLYLSARDQYSASAKINFISTSFANTNNYFTTTQVKQLIQLVPTENDRLVLAKSAWDNLTDPANYTQLYDLFTNANYRNNFAAFASSNGTNNGEVYTGTINEPMPDANFNALVTRISNRWGLGVKMTSLTEEFNNTSNFFTTVQTRKLIQLVSDEANRLTLGKLSYDNVVDPQNFPQLYDVFTTQASRDELDAFVRANSTGVGYVPLRIPMAGESFTSLYNTINNQYGLGAKMSSLTDVFANTNNNFTTTQARQLILLVSSETNRLQLAKSAYDNVVDPENFSQIYDIFSTQASRNELAAYVNSYSYNR